MANIFRIAIVRDQDSRKELLRERLQGKRFNNYYPMTVGANFIIKKINASEILGEILK